MKLLGNILIKEVLKELTDLACKIDNLRSGICLDDAYSAGFIDGIVMSRNLILMEIKNIEEDN